MKHFTNLSSPTSGMLVLDFASHESGQKNSKQDQKHTFLVFGMLESNNHLCVVSDFLPGWYTIHGTVVNHCQYKDHTQSCEINTLYFYLWQSLVGTETHSKDWVSVENHLMLNKHKSCHDIHLYSTGKAGNMVNTYHTHMYTTGYNSLLKSF